MTTELKRGKSVWRNGEQCVELAGRWISAAYSQRSFMHSLQRLLTWAEPFELAVRGMGVHMPSGFTGTGNRLRNIAEPVRIFRSSVSSLEATSWIAEEFGAEFVKILQESIDAGWNIEVTFDGKIVRVKSTKPKA